MNTLMERNMSEWVITVMDVRMYGSVGECMGG